LTTGNTAAFRSTLRVELVNPEPTLAAGVGPDDLEARGLAGLHEFRRKFDPEYSATILRIRLRDSISHARAAVCALPRFIGERYVEIEQRRSINPQGEFARRLREKTHRRRKAKADHSPTDCPVFLPLPLRRGEGQGAGVCGCSLPCQPIRARTLAAVRHRQRADPTPIRQRLRRAGDLG